MQDQLKTVKWFNAVSITIFIVLVALTGILYYTGIITWIVAIACAIISLFAASTIQIAESLQHILDKHTNPWGCYFLVYLNAKSDFYLKINDTISEIFILFETPVAS